MPQLDPHPANELGRGLIDPDPRNVLGQGILSPALEASLLAEGVVFATYTDEPGEPKVLVTSARRFHLIEEEMFQPARRLPRLVSQPELATIINY